MPTPRATLFVALLALGGLSACTSNGMYGSTHPHQHRDIGIDGDTAARVQARIHADNRQALRSTVSVNVKDGMVELLGEASTPQERQWAEEIAQQTYGVKRVKNLMTLRR